VPGNSADGAVTAKPGERLQLSVFQCRLTAQRHAELIALLDGIIPVAHLSQGFC